VNGNQADAADVRQTHASDEGCVQRQPEPATVGSASGERPPRVAAVILNYRTPEETVLAARALADSRRLVQDLIVVDNGSDSWGSDDGALWAAASGARAPAGGSEAYLRASLPEATVIQTGSNLGFSGGCNVGIRAALAGGADLVLLVNSDLIVAADAIGHLEAALRAHSTAGIAGPAVMVGSDPDRVESLGIRFSAATGRTRHHGFGCRAGEIAQAEVREVDGVSGCAMLIRREVFDRIGLLAEEYFFSFEDLDFCLRARSAGFATVCVGAARAYHAGGRSIGARSARRLYFATRNHLLLAQRLAPAPSRWKAALRGGWIVALGLAHAVMRADAPAPAGVASVVRGAWHHLRGRYGSDG